MMAVAYHIRLWEKTANRLFAPFFAYPRVVETRLRTHCISSESPC
jgi:hypothetical protein